jgi:acyl-CoA synthetase (AMP-forming)/AMP-acid ligase II
MRTPPPNMTSILDRLAKSDQGSGRFLWGAAATVVLNEFSCGSSFGGRLEELCGRSVLVMTRDQFVAALALIELDGVARRLVVCTPDFPSEHLPTVMARAGVDAIVSDHDPADAAIDGTLRVLCNAPLAPGSYQQTATHATEWVLLTSGTTGVPKMVGHSLATLTAPLNGRVKQGHDVVWGTFYDIRRYGGLQIFFRAVLGGGSFVVSGPDETLGDYLVRLGAHGATHVSGTPSHWRRVLMSPAARAIEPKYVRLSGEVADQAILNALRAFYPQASIGHAFASTEAGVGFEVNDGLEGFPGSLVQEHGEVAIKVDDGSLWIRSSRNADGYIGEPDAPFADGDGFVDTGDMVELRGDRYYFLGRRSGIINVGGLKVYPEEVEAVINRHPGVRMSMVRARKSPITGALVVADVVLHGEPDRDDARREILTICHEHLPSHKVPAVIRFVPSLAVAAAGKLNRYA